MRARLITAFLLATSAIAVNLGAGGVGASPSATTVKRTTTTTIKPTTTTTTIPLVSSESSLRSVDSRRDPNLASIDSLNWQTEEPYYGTPESSLPSWDSCSASFNGPTGKKNVNWVLEQTGNARSYSTGIKVRVRGTDGRVLPSVTLQAFIVNKPTICLRFTADANGWIFVPVRTTNFLFFGNTVDQWPKNPSVEVAQISTSGSGPIATVRVSNPVNKRSGLNCGLIKFFGYSKESLKGAISVIGAFAPGLGSVAASITSVTLSTIDSPTNGDPIPVATFFVGNGNDTQNVVRELSKSKNFVKVLQDPVNKTKIVATWADKAKVDKALTGVALVTTFASLYTGIKAVNNDYKTVGC